MTSTKKNEIVLLDDDQYADANHPAYREAPLVDASRKLSASRTQRIVITVLLVLMVVGTAAQMFAG